MNGNNSGGGLFDVAPAEDVGAQTQARYRYQADCAAPVCLAMIPDESLTAVLCETYEDYVVIRSDGPLELASVKHRELSQGPWTKPQLFAAGGLAHLFPNWIRSGKTCRCLIQTNAGLKPGENDAAGLAECCNSGSAFDDEVLSDAATRLGATDVDEARAFLHSVRIESGLPSKEHIAMTQQPYATEALKHLNLPPGCASDAYEAVVELIMRSNRANPVLDLSEATDMDRFRKTIAQDRLIRARTIRRGDVVAAIRARCASDSPMLVEASVPETSLTRKLRLGGMEETAIVSAQKLRAAWYAFERQWFGDDLSPVYHQLDDLRIRVLDMAADATSQAAQKWSDPYANQLRALIKQCVTANGVPQSQWLPLDDALLHGLVYQLTDECKVWWSAARLGDAGEA